MNIQYAPFEADCQGAAISKKIQFESPFLNYGGHRLLSILAKAAVPGALSAETLPCGDCLMLHRHHASAVMRYSATSGRGAFNNQIRPVATIRAARGR